MTFSKSWTSANVPLPGREVQIVELLGLLRSAKEAIANMPDAVELPKPKQISVQEILAKTIVEANRVAYQRLPQPPPEMEIVQDDVANEAATEFIRTLLANGWIVALEIQNDTGVELKFSTKQDDRGKLTVRVEHA